MTALKTTAILLLLSAVFSLVGSAWADAATRLPVDKIDPDAFAEDTQIELVGAGDDHAAVAWWIPPEFWASVLSRDGSVGEREMEKVLDTLKGTSLLAVVQADISSLGAFDYYSREEVLRGMNATYSDPEGRAVRLAPVSEVEEGLQVLLTMFKPILEAAMGELGKNMHFYVIGDSREGARVADPYRPGKISVELLRRDGGVIDGDLRMPINSLFTTRKCPNGEEADVSWIYCPWTGKKLDE